jgi:hypothetical protein
VCTAHYANAPGIHKKCFITLEPEIISCHTADSKPVKLEVNVTVILTPLVFPAQTHTLTHTLMYTCVCVCVCVCTAHYANALGIPQKGFMTLEPEISGPKNLDESYDQKMND